MPPIDVKVDGQDQPVEGHPYFDRVSIKVVDDRTIEEVDKKNRKMVTTSKTVVSQDGKTANFEFTDSSNTNADPVTGKGTVTQVAKGPAGSHAVSGSWVTSKMETLSDNGLTVTFKVEGDSLSMTNLTGQSYVAKVGWNGFAVQRRSRDYQRLREEHGKEHDRGNRQARREGDQRRALDSRFRRQNHDPQGRGQVARIHKSVHTDQTVGRPNAARRQCLAA